MTTAAAVPEPVFVDTNVLIYAAIPAFPLHVEARSSDFVCFSTWIDVLPLVPSP